MTTATVVVAATAQRWLLVPTWPGVPDYTMRTRLDGRDFNLHFRWNQREERWYMDLRSDIDEPLALGVKIIANWPLIHGSQFDLRLPPGLLMAADLSLDGSPPGFYDLGIGRRVELAYAPATAL